MQILVFYFLVFPCIAMCLTLNEKILLKIFGDLFLENFLQRWESEQWYFPHEIIFIWGMSVKKRLMYFSAEFNHFG